MLIAVARSFPTGAAAELETDRHRPMEEREDLMGPEQEELPASRNPQSTQSSVPAAEEEGMEERDMKEEREVEVELVQSVPGLQMSFIRGADLFGYVGIEAVLDQMRRKTMKAGLEFNIMVVGESGWRVWSCTTVVHVNKSSEALSHM